MSIKKSEGVKLERRGEEEEEEEEETQLKPLSDGLCCKELEPAWDTVSTHSMNS
jgi:hypothetical protein